VWSDLLSDDGDGSAEDEDGEEMAVGEETPGGGREGGRGGRELKNTKRESKSESPFEYGGSSGVPKGMLHDSSAWNGVLVCVCIYSFDHVYGWIFCTYEFLRHTAAHLTCCNTQSHIHTG